MTTRAIAALFFLASIAATVWSFVVARLSFNCQRFAEQGFRLSQFALALEH